MDAEKKRIFNSVIGNKLQMEFFKLFSGDIEESELIRNEPKLEIDRELNERFLDSN